MSKYFRLGILFTLIFLTVLPGVTMASDVDWQITFKDDGSLQEEVRISGHDIVPRDSSWSRSQQGDQYLLQREVKNWSSYQTLQDRLPLQCQQNNYILFKQTEIILSDAPIKGLFAQVSDLNLHLSIIVPGVINQNSANLVEESKAIWNFRRSSELLNKARILKYTTVDGLLMGIGILALGLLAVVILFTKRLKKVDHIIEEEYSVTKIKSNYQHKGN